LTQADKASLVGEGNLLVTNAHVPGDPAKGDSPSSQ
jgi:hypothetical protein